MTKQLTDNKVMAEALDRYMRGTSDSLVETGLSWGEKTEEDILIEENKCWDCKLELKQLKNFDWTCPKCESIYFSCSGCEELYEHPISVDRKGQSSEKEICSECKKCYCGSHSQDMNDDLSSDEENEPWLCRECRISRFDNLKETVPKETEKLEQEVKYLKRIINKLHKKIERNGVKCGKLVVTRGDGGGYYYCDEPILEGHYRCKFHSLNVAERLR